jgi:hypothetical protein
MPSLKVKVIPIATTITVLILLVTNEKYPGTTEAVTLHHSTFSTGISQRSKTTPSTGAKRNASSLQTRQVVAMSPLAAEVVATKPKKRTLSTGVKKKTKRLKVPAHTVQSVLDDFADTTEYGKTFRGLSTEKQQAEVDVLNKGAAKGLRGLVKNTMLDKQYTKLIGDKMRQFFIDSRASQA